MRGRRLNKRWDSIKNNAAVAHLLLELSEGWVYVHHVSETVLSYWNSTNMHMTRIVESLLYNEW